jgi:hypothetical protein
VTRRSNVDGAGSLAGPTFGFAVRLRGVRLDPDVLDSELFTSSGEGFGEVAATIVSHDAFDGNAEAPEVGDGGDQERDGAFLILVGEDIGTRYPGMIVDSDMDELPACALAEPLQRARLLAALSVGSEIKFVVANDIDAQLAAFALCREVIARERADQRLAGYVACGGWRVYARPSLKPNPHQDPQLRRPTGCSLTRGTSLLGGCVAILLRHFRR